MSIVWGTHDMQNIWESEPVFIINCKTEKDAAQLDLSQGPGSNSNGHSF